MSTTAEWTFMVYMAGDNDLAPALARDLEEMRKVGSSDDVNVVVQYDSAFENAGKRLLIQPSGKNETVHELGEIDSGAPETLKAFIEWSASRFPARRTALVLWNHGTGWEPPDVDRIARAVSSPHYSSAEMRQRQRSAAGLPRLLFRTSLERILRLPGANERAICFDDHSGSCLDTIELGRVLAGAARSLGKPFDLLALDACLMSNLEVAYQLKDSVRVMVASEVEGPSGGLPYDVLLRKLADDPAQDTAVFASKIVDTYIQSHVDRGYRGVLMQAALDLEKTAAVSVSLDRLGKALAEAMPQAVSVVWDAQRKSSSFYGQTLWDIAHLCEELEASTLPAPVLDAARLAREAARPGMGHCVLSARAHGAMDPRCGGLSIYMIPPPEAVSPFYQELDLSRQCSWARMLQVYHAAS